MPPASCFIPAHPSSGTSPAIAEAFTKRSGNVALGRMPRGGVGEQSVPQAPQGAGLQAGDVHLGKPGSWRFRFCVLSRMPGERAGGQVSCRQYRGTDSEPRGDLRAGGRVPGLLSQVVPDAA